MNKFADNLHPAVLWQALQNFLEQGGVILVVIMLTTFGLWMLILERHYYFWAQHKKVQGKALSAWNKRKEKTSWYALQIREQLLSIVKIKTERNLSTISLIVVVAPLLGLLGTVMGMMEVFDVMATTGASNARGMAAGVSKATIPTMAGMVVSLSGLFFSVSLKKKSVASIDRLSHQLVVGGEL